jgi:O-methyltransferase involved in polyketide biosynthesis
MKAINLEGIAETLLLPLWGRAVDNEKQNSILHDRYASQIVKVLGYDFSQIAKRASKVSMASFIARSVYFDEIIQKYIKERKNALIVNIGCGFDTTFERIDDGIVEWIDIDFPEVIDLRKKYIQENERRKFIAKSVFDIDWEKEIPKKENMLIMMAGIVYYFTEDELKELINKISNISAEIDIIFDYSSKQGISIINKRIAKDRLVDNKVVLKWGIDDINELGNWEKGIRIVDNIEIFREHKKRLAFFQRIEMNIFDKLKVMSLAHIKIKN